MTPALPNGAVDVALVRHAHAGTKGQDPGEDDQRPLSPRGRQQADRLARALAPLGPSRILTSTLRRCIDTVRPLAAQLDLSVEEEPALAPDRGADALSLVQHLMEERARAPQRPPPWVVCTHGEVLAALLPALAAGVPLPRTPPGAKGSVWLLDAPDAAGSAPHLRYVARP